ncbi:hypothetical protein GWE18_09090 [Bradyrhizobium sp. CSA112]|uniref:hypothetical protein n=1 Tax=Bradyrhizobium sp. CSA112 TaxID=2699170 RepID=UPI0023AF7878|nr:hypothetical protein [Bradyrhizobium sp. CSA112]MDE5453014.1 hypothetical protein [Bradyrhizobium sp. CSA112]
MTFLLAFVLSAAVFLAIRIFPLGSHRERGCDAYYFLMCARALREDWQLPIRLPPKYLAEPEEQWYPPLFPVLIALLPSAWLHRRHWAVNHVLDLAFAGGLFYMTRHYVGDFGAAATILVYAAQPALVQEFAALTSRPLGMLLQLAAVAAGYACIIAGSWSAGALAVVAVALLVYAHKLSLQLLWFLFPFLALVMGAWEWVAILVAGYALAGVVWPGFFMKIQRAHIDIVSFWARNWPLLGANPVRQSPLYGDGKTKTSYYDSAAVRSAPAFLKTVLQINIFAVFLPLGLVAPLQGVPFADFLWWWATGIYLWVGATHFVSRLRCLGLAQQYVKFGYAPVLGFLAIYLQETASIWIWFAAAACVAVQLRWYVLTALALRAEPAIPHSDRLGELLQFIEAQPAPRIMVFPYHLADELAYRSKAQVLWGTHGYDFERVEPFFPVLQFPLSSLVNAFGLSHVVLDTNFAAPEELHLDAARGGKRIGRFIVFKASDAIAAVDGRT